MVNGVLPAPASQLGRTKLNVEDFPSQTMPIGWLGARLELGTRSLRRRRRCWTELQVSVPRFCWPESVGSALADDASPWRVSKSSGEVWMTTSAVQEASLTNEATLKPGDTIRTGRNGRVLLTRGEETMLVSPNSVIALPEHQRDGLSTTIIEQAGSVLIQAEKRNVKHFQVETPYLAAVVKG